MKRVDALLLKIQDAIRADTDIHCSFMILPHDGKWTLSASVSNGKMYNSAEITTLPVEDFDSEEEAVAAAKRIEAAHFPEGARAGIPAEYLIINFTDDSQPREETT